MLSAGGKLKDQFCSSYKERLLCLKNSHAINLNNSLGWILSCENSLPGSVAQQLMEGRHKGAVCSFCISFLSLILLTTSCMAYFPLWQSSLSAFPWLWEVSILVRHYLRQYLEHSLWRSLNTAFCITFQLFRAWAFVSLDALGSAKSAWMLTGCSPLCVVGALV